MAKPHSPRLFEVVCPCCQAALQIDPETRAVITFKASEKPRELADIDTGLERLRGEAARREEAFQKSVEHERMSQQILARKFDELFKKAKENPNEPPPKRDIDLD
jgi:predicted nuclease with TOPRIM domain